jgi:hypothetical protein
MANSVRKTIYLGIFQERLSGVRDHWQKGGLQAFRKYLQGVCRWCQACDNVVQPSWGETGLGWHFDVGVSVLGGMGILSHSTWESYVVTG